MIETVRKAVECLGRGFDINSDFRIKYCRGERRLVLLSEEKVELAVPGFGAVHGVSVDVKCDKGDRIRYQSDVLEFRKMSELLNRKSSISGKTPSGLFNSAFGLNGGSWAQDASRTKCLAMDGYFISLFNLRVDRYPLSLADDVIAAVPSSWDPAALARFIERFGTHVVVGLSVGGQDVVFVRQDQSSDVPFSDVKEHLDELGDQLFTGTCVLQPPSQWRTKTNGSRKVPEAFNVFHSQQSSSIVGDGFSSISSRKGITVICSRRGGAASAGGHCEWLPTVASRPDAINFTFTAITSLLTDVPGKGFLTHAINLYLRYKPPLSDLESFLDFQSHKQWAPMFGDLPLGPYSNRSVPTASLHLNLMGPKIYVNTSQVLVGTGPVTGMRLFLEGKKNNRLSVHLQHLTTTPTTMNMIKQNGSAAPRWSDAESTAETAYYEPVSNRNYSHVCTAPIEHGAGDNILPAAAAASIVTGAQLHVKEHAAGGKALHLRLLFSEVPGRVAEERSVWDEGRRLPSQRMTASGGLLSAISTTFSAAPSGREVAPDEGGVVIDSAAPYNKAPPVGVREKKLIRYVDTSEVCKGPQDTPGHWLVTGAKLELRGGKIALRVKFSLLQSVPPKDQELEHLH